MKVYVETDRLLMREFTEDDAPGLFALDSDPEVHKYLGNMTVKTIEESRDIIRFIRKQYEENGIGRWAVIDKATGDFIGWSGLKYEKNLRRGMEYYDVGYRLRRQYWGQGIATETAIESLKYGFGEMGVEEICAAAHVDNAASNRVLQKIGMALTETFDYDGELHNWYRLKRADWKP
jgi:ribosomal-protein-alanine N-acetyltransferase